MRTTWPATSVASLPSSSHTAWTVGHGGAQIDSTRTWIVDGQWLEDKTNLKAKGVDCTPVMRAVQVTTLDERAKEVILAY